MTRLRNAEEKSAEAAALHQSASTDLLEREKTLTAEIYQLRELVGKARRSARRVGVAPLEVQRGGELAGAVRQERRRAAKGAPQLADADERLGVEQAKLGEPVPTRTNKRRSAGAVEGKSAAAEGRRWDHVFSVVLLGTAIVAAMLYVVRRIAL